MGLGRLVEAWNNYGIQMLVLMSLVLQLLLFILPIVRRHKMLKRGVYSARLVKLLLWLAYQLADTTAIYVLGHMAISSSHLPGEVMALWASLVLVHLGGQDTMTAYSLEDNRLWKRHLLTLLVQAAGVVYVLHGLRGAGGGRSSGPYPRLRAASALMFVVGFLKFAERIWVLRASDMNKLFKRQGEDRRQEYYARAPHARARSERAEEDLKQAHELLYFCMCQFMDSKVSLSPYQKSVIKCYAGEKRLCELVHLQLSLMHDMLYTKASVIHTWYGCLIRVFSWLATAITCMLVFLSGTGSSTDGVWRFDVGVTYALLAGAFLLETASSLRAAGSTWTYQILRSGGWVCLGRVVLAFRWLVRAAEQSRRRCPSYIGGQAGSTLGSYTSPVVDEIEEMVTAYVRRDQKEKLMNRRCGLSLDQLLLSSSDQVKVTLTQGLEQLEFDEYLVLWYFATREFTRSFPSSSESRLSSSSSSSSSLLSSSSSSSLRRVVEGLATYMMYLFMKLPHMLPSPVRHEISSNWLDDDRTNSVFQKLREELLGGTTEEWEIKLKPLLWVWVEMLCYAASHCNRESHARALSNGLPESITVLWVVRAALFEIDIDSSYPSSVPPVLDTDLIANHRRAFSV